MKIMIIDRDADTAEMLQSGFVQAGHEVVLEPIRRAALDRLKSEKFDVVAVDPAPLSSAREVALPLRWDFRGHYPYILQLAHEPDALEDIVRCGLNDVIAKPIDWGEVTAKIENAARLVGFMEYLQQSDELAASGMIFSKRGFYKLMLSALDRAHRYGERAFVMLIRMTNFTVLCDRLGTARAEQLLQATADYLTKLHRMSDFLGQVAAGDFALLLLRPAVDTEPQDAAERFAIALNEFRAEPSFAERPDYAIELWSLPSGAVLAQNSIKG